MPVLPARPAVQRDLIGHIVASIREQCLLRQLGLAVPGIEAIERCLARIGGAVHERVVRAVIPTAALSVFLILVLGRDGEKARVRQRQALPQRRCQRFTVTSATREHRRGRPGRPRCGHRRSVHIEIGIAPAVGHIRAAAVACFTQTQIHHAGDGIGAVLSRRAIAQHFDRLHDGARNRVEVGSRRASSDRAVHVHKRRRVQAFAVHEHQCLIGRKAPQRRGPHRIRAVGEAGARKVEGRQARGERLVDLSDAEMLQLVARNDVDRCGRVQNRAVRDACTRHDDLFEGFAVAFARGTGRMSDQYADGRYGRSNGSSTHDDSPT